MAKRRCHCPKKTCAKRKGSPRFSGPCKSEFRQCQRNELKSTGSMRSAGKVCMKRLQQCARTRGKRR